VLIKAPPHHLRLGGLRELFEIHGRIMRSRLDFSRGAAETRREASENGLLCEYVCSDIC
jgi:hypothetical protein